ncbi:MAG: HEAT repeat domain-containing protein [Pirellulales bacterium]
MRRNRRLTKLAVTAALLLGMQDARPQVVASSPSRERELLAVLCSETPESEKAITCKLLAIHGSPAAIGDLAALLGNERLSSWARIALEVIPGPEADAALRTATESLSGRQLVGVINSIGVRGDAAAVGLLEKRLADTDGDVAVSAAAALGRIGTPAAAAILSRALAAGVPDRDAVAEACVVAAEQLLAAGKHTEAVALASAVWRADVSEQRRAEGARCGILARGEEGIPMLVELLRSPSKRLFNMGLFTAREAGVRGRRDTALAEAVDLALVREVVAAPATPSASERAMLVIDALAERNGSGAGKTVQAAMLDAATAGAKPIRLAAIRALGRVGDAAVVPRLLTIAADPEPEFAFAAREAISVLPGEAVDREITARLRAANPGTLPTLVSLVGDRRIGVVADVVPLVDHGDAAVRLAAIEALGAIIDLPNLDVLVRKVAAPRDEAEGVAATAALNEAAVRMADRDACAEKIAAAAMGTRQTVLLDLLGDVGGTRALAAVGAAATSGDEAIQDTATRLLGKWMTADAAPVLLKLATSDAAGTFRGRCLKGYVRIARQFALPDDERAGMCRKALAATEDPATRKAVIEILVRYPSAATLAVAKEAVTMPDVEAEAKAAVAGIAAKLAKPAG